MHLEFLHNPPLNQKANAILMGADFPNENIFSPSVAQENKTKLLKKMGKKNALQLGFDSLSLQGLLAFLIRELDSPICLGIGNHQQIILAATALKSLEISLLQDGRIDFDALGSAIQSGYKIFIFPSINQDIFSQNDLKEIFDFIQNQIQNFFLIWDASLSFTQGQLEIPLMDPRIAYLMNAESLGLVRGFGAFFYDLEINFGFMNENIRFFEALDCALMDRDIHHSGITFFDQEKFFNYLQEILGNNVGLFVPFENSAPNTLALRFNEIKARLLLQDLLIKGFYGANGQECLFGLFKPSFVLQKMGYTESQSRELLSFSVQESFDLKSVAQTLAQSYKQIKGLGL